MASPKRVALVCTLLVAGLSLGGCTHEVMAERHEPIGAGLRVGLIASGYEPSYPVAMSQAGGHLHQTILWHKVEFSLDRAECKNASTDPAAKVVRSPSSNPATCYNWGAVDKKFKAFLGIDPKGPGRPIGSVRILGKQRWPGSDCPTGVKACPPAAPHVQHFENFVAAATERYGPGTHYDVPRWMLWNEPNVAVNWGRSSWGRNGSKAKNAAISAGAKRYIALLQRFRAGAKRGNPAVKVDAGEIAQAQKNSTEPNLWTRVFVKNAPGGLYDALTIHPFSQTPAAAAEKVQKTRNLLKKHGVGGKPIGVTAFGWSVGKGDPNKDGWKCVANEAEQAAYFRQSIKAFKQIQGVHQAVWFNLTDNDLGMEDGDLREGSSDPVCINTSYYTGANKLTLNNYGVYKRKRNGTTGTLYPREICNAFRAASGLKGKCATVESPAAAACGCWVTCTNGSTSQIAAEGSDAHCQSVGTSLCEPAGYASHKYVPCH
jgi:hypothetical protein